MDEEARLREVLECEYPHRVPELDIAIHTGLRRSSQYALDWPDVNFESETVRIRWAKPGEKQFVRLNEVSRAAFLALHSGPIADLRAKLSRRIGTPADFSLRPGAGIRSALAARVVRASAEAGGHSKFQLARFAPYGGIASGQRGRTAESGSRISRSQEHYDNGAIRALIA